MDIFHESVVSGNKKRVLELIHNGADVNRGDEHGYTPLMKACGEGHYDIAVSLLDNGAEINARDLYGNSALINACYAGHIKIVKLLIERGADVNIQDRNGGTAIVTANYHGYDEIVKLLWNNGAVIPTKDSNGNFRYGAAELHTLLTANMLTENPVQDQALFPIYKVFSIDRLIDMKEAIKCIEKLDLAKTKCEFRNDSTSHFGNIRPSISFLFDHLFRSILPVK